MRKLTLHKESLAELDAGELRALAGAEAATNRTDCCPYEVISRLFGTCGICSATTTR